MRKFFLLAVVVAVGVPAITLYFNKTKAPESPIELFRLLSQVQVDGNAEIIQASPDGQLLLFTNTDRQRVDIFDLSNAAEPKPMANIPLPGEPTSVAISPDGQWALATVYLSESKHGKAPRDARLPGGLALIDLREPAAAKLVTLIGIGHHPDSLAVTKLGSDLIALIAIENEPVVVTDGVVAKNKYPGQTDDVSLPGALQIVTINPYSPQSYRVSALDLNAERLRAAGLLFPEDPQPEYVVLSPDRSLAAVSLQENNGIVVFDPYTAEIKKVFGLGTVADRLSDLSNNKKSELVENYPGKLAEQEKTSMAGTRFPDAIAFSSSGQFILSADEGEMPLTGGRGFSIWRIDGTFVFDDGGEIERAAVDAGLYPDDRSDKKGIEVEGLTTGELSGVDYAFVLSERGGFMAIYNLTIPATPALISVHETGTAPESAVVIAARGLIVVGDEKSGKLSIFAHSSATQ